MRKVYKYLNLDQASKTTGFCVTVNKKIKKVGIIQVDDAGAPPLVRLQDVYRKIERLVAKEKPSVIVMEGTQYQNNAGVYGTLSQLQGLIMAIALSNNIPFAIVEPTRWKTYCGIKGKNREEQKNNTRLFVKNRFGFDVSEDEADAIGIAVWAINNIREGDNKSPIQAKNAKAKHNT